MAEAPKAAIFDVFGTVVDWRSGVAAEVAKAFPDIDAHAFADAWRGEYQPAMERVRSGARGYIALDNLHLENLAIVLGRFGLRLDEEAALSLNRAWEKLPPWPDSVEGLAAIRAKMPVAPCSNGSIALMTHLARFGGLGWDCILGAEVGRGYKPDPKVYLASCAALGLRPDEVVMVACHNDDLAAARRTGLQTAYFPRADELGPGVKQDLAPAEDWDFIASDMIDLATQL
ncbi:MAG: haloacid dehalogenase type II [Pseudomonadota bacterium]